MSNLFEAMAEEELRGMLRRYQELLPDTEENKPEKARVGQWLYMLAMRATPVFLQGQADSAQTQQWPYGGLGGRR